MLGFEAYRQRFEPRRVRVSFRAARAAYVSGELIEHPARFRIKLRSFLQFGVQLRQRGV